MYYSYSGEGKGLEVHCWKQEASWYSGLLPRTNRLKTVDEVQWLQDNLPCPINKMCEILDTILEENEKEYCFVYIVSIPPKAEELKHTSNDSETLRWLREQLDLLPTP